MLHLTRSVSADGESWQRLLREGERIVKGHHVYKVVWTPFWGEELSIQPEDHNDHDEHAIAVTRDGRTVGHVPRIISRVSWFFLRRGGHIICRITGQRKHGDGLEVPCVYVYFGSSRMVEKLKGLLEVKSLQ